MPPGEKDALDRAVAFNNIAELSNELGKRGIDFRKLKATSAAISKGAQAADLVGLEESTVELEVLRRKLQRRENFFHAKINNLQWTFVTTVMACFAAGATLQKLFDPVEKIQAAISEKEAPEALELLPIQNPPPNSSQLPQKSNGPDFLNPRTVALHGLSLLVANNDAFDKFIFNSVTGNRMFAKTFDIQGGYPLDFEDRQFIMPYGAFLFKAFNNQSNVHLPKRLGAGEYAMWPLAELFNTVTKYRASDEAEIKTIVATSYELSFGIKIPHEHMQIVPKPDGRVETIRYTGPNPRNLIGETTIAEKVTPDPENPERWNLAKTSQKRWGLVNSEGELVFPPSVVAEQGIAIPYSGLPDIKRINYTKTFTSQGRRIAVKIDVPIDSVLAQQKELFRKKEPQQFYWDKNGRPTIETEINRRLARGENVQMTSLFNLSWYIPSNDPIVTALAHAITDPFETSREKVQAILDFLHEFHYVPDAYGEAPRTPRVSLISRGGDCEDSSILGVALARAVGMECVFLYLQDHAAPACDVGGPGTAMAWNDGKRYEWAETTGGVRTADPSGRIIEDRAWRVGEQPQDRSYGKIRWVQRVGGPLVPLE